MVTAGYPNFNQIDDEIIAIYRKYLNRSPTSGELAALRVSPNIQSRLSTLPIEMMAAQEYYDAAGNNNQVWLQKVFFTIVGKQPSPAEFNEWNQRLAQLGNSRTALLRQLYRCTTTLNAVYFALFSCCANVLIGTKWVMYRRLERCCVNATTAIRKQVQHPN